MFDQRTILPKSRERPPSRPDSFEGSSPEDVSGVVVVVVGVEDLGAGVVGEGRERVGRGCVVGVRPERLTIKSRSEVSR